MEYKKLSFEIKEKILYIGFGQKTKKSMTTLDKPSLEELSTAISKAKELSEKKEIEGLIFFSHKAGCFLAGVDLEVIQSLGTVEEAIQGAKAGQDMYNILEDIKVPTMALIDGVCLGGGLELALSCDKIMVSDSPKTMLGLPEVMLGVLPGFGGTYRLPKRVGLPAALDMILTGKKKRARACVKMGLADEMMPAQRLLALAPQYLKKEKKNKRNFKSLKNLKGNLMHLAGENFLTRKLILDKARETVMKLTKGFYPAPLKILSLIENHMGKEREAYLKEEAKGFGELSQTSQSKNLLHVFFLTDASKKRKKLKKGEEISIEKGGVLGAGTMGGGIAWLFAKNNQAPIMKDLNKEALELGLKQSSRNFSRGLKRRHISHGDFVRMQTSIRPTMNFSGFKSIDLLIEAIVENLDIKKKVLTETEEHLRDDAMITSNTSSLSINKMAQALKKPERFAGLHFFNPVNKMPLVEIITHDRVSPEVVDNLYNWCLQVKKTPIVVKDGPGFLVNRILMPFINESAYLLEEGVSIEDLDKAILNFGMPMGACRLMDEVGIDVLVKVGAIMEEGLGERAKACSFSEKIYKAGFHGKKNGKGFYRYDEKGRHKEVNEEIRGELPSGNKKMDERTIQMRVFLPMINEAANILSEGIVDKAETVDLGLIYGIGFPPFRGGLLKYADSEGLERIAKEIRKFASEVSETRYELSPYLEKLVQEKKGFYA